MLMMRSIIRVAGFAGALAVLASCGGDSGTGVRASVTGTYQLSTVNGQPLPFTENSSGAVVVITAGQLVAESNGAFRETITRTTTPPSGTATTATTAATGTYTVGNQVIVFTYAGAGGPAGTLLGSLTSSGLSIQNGLNSFEYKK
jgi:hypothetical protein